MNQNKLLYALMASRMGSSSVDKKTKFKQAITSSFFSDGNPVSTIINAKKYIEVEEEKEKKKSVQTSLATVRNTNRIMQGAYNGAQGIITAMNIKAETDVANGNATVFDLAFFNTLSNRQKLIAGRAFPNFVGNQVILTLPPMPQNFQIDWNTMDLSLLLNLINRTP